MVLAGDEVYFVFLLFLVMTAIFNFWRCIDELYEYQSVVCFNVIGDGSFRLY